MELFKWLDSFVENAETQDSSDYYSESIDDSTIFDRMENIVNILIEKIQEMVVRIKAKYAQIKFAAAVKRVGTVVNRQFKTSVILPEDARKLLAKMIKVTEQHTIESEKRFRKFVNGALTPGGYEEYVVDMKSINKTFSSKMASFEKELGEMVRETGIKESLKAGKILVEYDIRISEITSEYNKMANSITRELSTMKRTPATGKPPEIYMNASQVACKSIAAIWSEFTRMINRLINSVVSSGDKILRHVISLR